VKRYRAIIDRSLTSRPTTKAAPKCVSDSTRRKDALCTRMFTRFCYQRGIMDRDPLKDYAVPSDNKTIPPTPTESDLRQFLDCIARMYDPSKNPKIKAFKPKTRAFFRTRNLAVVVGLAQTGARLGEILSLTMADYDPDDLEITFRNTKTNVDRQVPITRAWEDMVAEYLKHRPRMSASPNLFVNEFGESITVDAWEKTFRRIRDFANECRRCFGTGKRQTDAHGRAVVLSGRGWERLPKEPCVDCGGSGNLTEPVVKWSMHGTRHYAVTKLCDRAGIDKAQAIVGHTNIATTQRYNHIAKDRLRAAMADADLLPMDRPVMVNRRSEANRKRKLV
jgi:site-specific recombinase XerD